MAIKGGWSHKVGGGVLKHIVILLSALVIIGVPLALMMPAITMTTGEAEPYDALLLEEDDNVNYGEVTAPESVREVEEADALTIDAAEEELIEEELIEDPEEMSEYGEEWRVGIAIEEVSVNRSIEIETAPAWESEQFAETESEGQTESKQMTETESEQVTETESEQMTETESEGQTESKQMTEEESEQVTETESEQFAEAESSAAMLRAAMLQGTEDTQETQDTQEKEEIDPSVTYVLPATGGDGTYTYIISGLILMLSAAALLYRKRKW